MVDQPNNPVTALMGSLIEKSQDAVEAARKAADEEKDAAEKIRKTQHAAELMQKADLLQALLSFFSEMFFGDSLQDYDDFGADPEETEQDRAEAIARDNTYTGDRDAARRSARDSFTSGTVSQYTSRLASMRQRYGEGLQTKMPFEEAGHVNSPRGMRIHPVTHEHKMHQGADMVANDGSAPDILATMPGIVVAKGRQGNAGNVVEILDIYNVRHRFFHLADGSIDNLQVGQEVAQGDKIGVMGKTGRVTGVHLHYEQVANGERRNPIIMGKEWGRNEQFAGHDAHNGQEQHAEAKEAPRVVANPPVKTAEAGHGAARIPAKVAGQTLRVAGVSHTPAAQQTPHNDSALASLAHQAAEKARGLMKSFGLA